MADPTTPKTAPNAKSKIGLKNMVVAPIVKDTEEELEYGPLQLVAGSIEASISPENADADVQYADDVEWDALYPDPEITFNTTLVDLPLVLQGTFLGGLFDSTNDKVQRVSNLSAELTRLNDAIEKAKANGGTFETEDGGFLGLDDLNNQKVSTMGLLSDAVSSLSDEDLSTVGTGISNLIAALDSGEGTPEQIEKWKSELESLKSLIEILNPGALTPTGTNVSAGIAEGMVGYSFTGDADTVKTNILNTINTALDIHSPAGATKPTGEYVAAGIGQGMKAYDFSVDILAIFQPPAIPLVMYGT